MCGGTARERCVRAAPAAPVAVTRLRDLQVVDYSIRGTALYGYSLGYVSAHPSLADVMRTRPAES